MIKKVLIFLIAIQFIIYHAYCQETLIKFKSKYETDSSSFRIVNTTIDEDSILKLIFILPVENFKKTYKYGTGLEECKALINSNKISNNIVFVQPDYHLVPWYGNHDTDENNNQLVYTAELIKAVRLKYSHHLTKVYLLGFSKSGFGSMNLITKYPELIDGVMIWDTPLSTKWSQEWGMHHVFGTEENFMKNYYLMRGNDMNLNVLKNKLIIIGGYDYFEISTKKFLKRLDEYKINYIYDNNIRFKHAWNKDWIYQLFQHSGFIIKK